MPSLGYGGAGRVPQPPRVGLVVAEQRRGRPAAGQRHAAEQRVLGQQPAGVLSDLRPGDRRIPRPAVAEPQRRQHVQRGGLRTGVADLDSHAEIVRRRLRVVDGDVPVAVVVEGARVEEFVLGSAAIAAGVLCHELVIRKGSLRIDVAPAHPGMRRRGVQVPPVLLAVLAVIALVPGEAEDALLEDRVAAVPEREREAQQLLLVADATEAVLAPAVRARTRVVVREGGPRVAVGAVVLAHGAPGPFAHVRPPAPPRCLFASLDLGVVTCHAASVTAD